MRKRIRLGIFAFLLVCLLGGTMVCAVDQAPEVLSPSAVTVSASPGPSSGAEDHTPNWTAIILVTSAVSLFIAVFIAVRQANKKFK